MKEKDVTIRLIRNATLRIHYAGKEILVDPMLAEKALCSRPSEYIRHHEYILRCR